MVLQLVEWSRLVTKPMGIAAPRFGGVFHFFGAMVGNRRRLAHRHGKQGTASARDGTRRLPATAAIQGAALMLVPLPASAHPHVWITVKGEIVYGPDRTVTEIRYDWSFDEAYSAYAVVGLERDSNGTITPDGLKNTSIVNAQAFQEAQYFTFITSDGSKIGFSGASDYRLGYDNGRLNLAFRLHLQNPIPATHGFEIKIYDPTFFVSLTLSGAEDAIKAVHLPAECAVRVNRPESLVDAQRAIADEVFLRMEGNSTYGARYANEVDVTCTKPDP
jgi:ABC-type uncharacterized transport system substrate-binding protein